MARLDKQRKSPIHAYKLCRQAVDARRAEMDEIAAKMVDDLAQDLGDQEMFASMGRTLREEALTTMGILMAERILKASTDMTEEKSARVRDMLAQGNIHDLGFIEIPPRRIGE